MHGPLRTVPISAAQPAERRWSWWGRVIFYVVGLFANVHSRRVTNQLLHPATPNGENASST